MFLSSNICWITFDRIRRLNKNLYSSTTLTNFSICSRNMLVRHVQTHTWNNDT